MALAETVEQGPVTEAPRRRWHAPAWSGPTATAATLLAVLAFGVAGAGGTPQPSPSDAPGIAQTGFGTGATAAAETVTLRFQLALAQAPPLQVRGLGPVRGARVDWALSAPAGSSPFGEQWGRLTGTLLAPGEPIEVRVQLHVTDCAALRAGDGSIPMGYADQYGAARSTELSAPTGSGPAGRPTRWNQLAAVQGCRRGLAGSHGMGTPMAALPGLNPGAPRAPRSAHG